MAGLTYGETRVYLDHIVSTRKENMTLSTNVHHRTDKRIHGFDLLRGLCALAVATYHMLHWSNTASLHSWELFGVYVFFVLSGASMVVAYRDRFAKGLPVSKFIAFRFARLAPLYILVTVAYGIYAILHLDWDVEWGAKAFLNLSFLFGLANPGDSSRVTGGWSLGIEFAFYLMFPVILSLVLSRCQMWIGALLAVSQLVFVNMVVAGRDLASVWVIYTQPLAFIAYFYLGCVIGNAVLDGKNRLGWAFWPCFAVLLAGSGPSASETIAGIRGCVLFAISIMVVYFSAGMALRDLGKNLATLLGDASYGVYLLHPFAFAAVKRAATTWMPVAIPLSLLVTLIMAKLSYDIFENPIRNWSKRRLDETASRRCSATSLG